MVREGCLICKTNVNDRRSPCSMGKFYEKVVVEGEWRRPLGGVQPWRVQLETTGMQSEKSASPPPTLGQTEF